MNRLQLITIFPEIGELPAEEIEKLVEYYTSVQLLSKDALNIEFNNKDERHAVIVMSEIFRTAQDIKIFSGYFSGDISDKSYYRNSITDAVTSNKDIQIVFENSPNPDSKCLNELMALKPNYPNLSISVLNEEYKNKHSEANSGRRINHFTIGNDNMFRFETDTKEFKAFCNFDDKEITSKLNANFHILKSNSTPYNR